MMPGSSEHPEALSRVGPSSPLRSPDFAADAGPPRETSGSRHLRQHDWGLGPGPGIGPRHLPPPFSRVPGMRHTLKTRRRRGQATTWGNCPVWVEEETRLRGPETQTVGLPELTQNAEVRKAAETGKAADLFQEGLRSSYSETKKPISCFGESVDGAWGQGRTPSRGWAQPPCLRISGDLPRGPKQARRDHGDGGET